MKSRPLLKILTPTLMFSEMDKVFQIVKTLWIGVDFVKLYIRGLLITTYTLQTRPEERLSMECKESKC